MKYLIRFSAKLFLSALVFIAWIGFQECGVSTAAMVENGQLGSSTNITVYNDHMWLHVLVIQNGKEEGYSVQLDENELKFCLPASLVNELLDDGIDSAKDPLEIEAILTLVDQEFDPSDTTGIEEVLLLYNDVVYDTWTCIKCCFAGWTWIKQHSFCNLS